jgi:hypothetical protein
VAAGVSRPLTTSLEVPEDLKHRPHRSYTVTVCVRDV